MSSSTKNLNKTAKLLHGDKNTSARVARSRINRINRIRSLNREVKNLTDDTTETVGASGATLTDICGIATLGALRSQPKPVTSYTLNIQQVPPTMNNFVTLSH